MKPARDLSERFWEKVARGVGSDCWEWTAAIGDDGYGKFHISSTEGVDRAHRIAYRLMVGPIPAGLQLDHLCRNRSCVNPAHLEAVTQAENIRRGEIANRTHCPRGHEYTAQNTDVRRGRRHCRSCIPFHNAQRRAKYAAERALTTT